MKKLLSMLLVFAISLAANAQLLKKLGDKVKDKTEQRADQKVDQAIDKSLDKTEEGAKNATKTNKDEKKENAKAVKDTAVGPENNSSSAVLKVYNNYDFVPGDKILFEDHFTDDQDGEFATHWELKSGQAVLNKIKDELAMHLTDGNYASVLPRMKTEKYLSDPFTLEFDWYHVPGAYGVILQLTGYDKQLGFDRQSEISIQPGDIGFTGTSSNVSLSKSLTDELRESLDNSWHHVAVAFKNHQLKIYLDQFRVLVVPDTKEDYTSLDFAGIGDEKLPIVFKNVRLASGGNMNMIGKKFTESKIVTHGINFDIDKASIKPESMGTLNMIVQVMRDNPEIKFEIDGHTDNTGNAQHNMQLSQQRADAVKDQLVKMGIDASRLTTKGFGDSKPMNDNSTLEGKANNRRVEFVKM